MAMDFARLTEAEFEALRKLVDIFALKRKAVKRSQVCH